MSGSRRGRVASPCFAATWVGVTLISSAACTTSPDLATVAGRWEGAAHFQPDCQSCPADERWIFQLNERTGHAFDGEVHVVRTRVADPDTVDMVVSGRARTNGYLVIAVSCQPWEVCIPEPVFYGGLRIGADSIVFYMSEFGSPPTIDLGRR